MEAAKENKLKSVVESKKFEGFILSVIILNTICFGLETVDSIVANFWDILSTLNSIFICIFVLEAVLKIVVLKGRYFKSGWNIFDFTIVVLSLISGIFSGIRALRILRLLRILRSLRMISGIKKLSGIVQALLTSIPWIGWTGLLMLLIYYVYAILGIQLFNEAFPQYFGSLPAAFITLFSLTTMEGWQGIVYPFTEMYPASWVYFISFFMIVAFILVNIVVGIVVDNTKAVAQSESEENPLISSNANLHEKINLLYEEISRQKEQLNNIQQLLEKNGGKND